MDGRPLVITDDDDLLEAVLRIAAAAGVEILHARSPGSRIIWRSASVILLDAGQVRAAVLAGLPRRPGVTVISVDEPDGGVWEHCVLLGVERTMVLPLAEDNLIQTLADTVSSGPGGGRVIAVIGARGGAGASVFCGAIAVAGLDNAGSVLLADCDPWGAGLDLLMGLEADPGLRWNDLAAPAGRVAADALHQSLPSVLGRRMTRPGSWFGSGGSGGGVLSVLAHDREPIGSARTPSPEALSVVLDSCRRAGELAILDVPRAPDPVGDQALESADLIVIVAPSDIPGCYAARRILVRLADLGGQRGLVVRGPSPIGLGPVDLANSLDLPLIAAMRPQPHLAKDIDLGKIPGSDPRSPLGRAARKVIAAAAALPGPR